MVKLVESFPEELRKQVIIHPKEPIEKDTIEGISTPAFIDDPFTPETFETLKYQIQKTEKYEHPVHQPFKPRRHGTEPWRAARGNLQRDRKLGRKRHRPHH